MSRLHLLPAALAATLSLAASITAAQASPPGLLSGHAGVTPGKSSVLTPPDVEPGSGFSSGGGLITTANAAEVFEGAYTITWGNNGTGRIRFRVENGRLEYQASPAHKYSQPFGAWTRWGTNHKGNQMNGTSSNVTDLIGGLEDRSFQFANMFPPAQARLSPSGVCYEYTVMVDVTDQREPQWRKRCVPWEGKQ